MWCDGVLMTGTRRWQWHGVWGCEQERGCGCACCGDLAGLVDDGRVMRWSHAAEIRPVGSPPLSSTVHTHTHTIKLHKHTHTQSFYHYPQTLPLKIPDNATCFLAVKYTHFCILVPPVISLLIIDATGANSQVWVNEPVPVVAPGAAVRFLSGVNTFVARQVGLCGGGEVAELTLEGSLSCWGWKRQEVDIRDEKQMTWEDKHRNKHNHTLVKLCSWHEIGK